MDLWENKSQSAESEDVRSQQEEQSKPLSNSVIKNIQTKFLIYVNQLNSSIVQSQSYKARKCQDIYKKQQSLSQIPKNQQKSDNFQNYSIDLVKKYRNSGSRNSRNSRNNRNSRISRSSITKKEKEYNILEASIRDGKVHGKAIIQLPNGCKFEGEVSNNELQQGFLIFPDKSFYKGKLKNELPHGDGILTLYNGISYKANFNNGEMEDRGIINYDNGDIYTGQIKNFKKHGFGELSFANGDRYIGDFQAGDITGQGVYYKGKNILAEGIWKNGQFLGNMINKSTKSTFSIFTSSNHPHRA